MILKWDRDFLEQVIFLWWPPPSNVLTLDNVLRIWKSSKKPFTDFCDFYSFENFPMLSY